MAVFNPSGSLTFLTPLLPLAPLPQVSLDLACEKPDSPDLAHRQLHYPDLVERGRRV